MQYGSNGFSSSNKTNTFVIKQMFPGFKNDLEERRFEKAQRKRAAGKGPPKKGSGKRSLKKK